MLETADALRWLKDACALILTHGQARGSCYLIAPDLVATCAHVVGGVEPEQSVEVKFPWGSVQARVERVDLPHDTAILRLERPAAIPPLRRASRCGNQAPWIAWGYPWLTRRGDTEEPAGLVIEGTVRDASATDTLGAPTLQLFSKDIASGRGAPPHGLSGSPVLVLGEVVGHLKRILIDPEEVLASGSSPTRRAELGLVYACPIQRVEALAGLERRGPSRRAQPAGAPYDKHWYVNREAEERIALSHLDHAGAPVVLWGPERFGKSTMLNFLLDRVRQDDLEGGRRSEVIEISLRALFQEGEQVRLETLLGNLARQLVRAVRDHEDWVTELEQDEGLPPLARLKVLMEQRILSLDCDRVILALEWADAVWGLPCQNAFYGMLRDWCEWGSQGGSLSRWSKLRLMLALSTTPSLLISGPQANRSPWNLVNPIHLRDFRIEEVEVLARLHGLDWSRQEMESRLLSLVGGHPFLLRLVMHRASVLGAPLHALLEDEETALEELFGEFLGNMVLRLEQEPERLAAAVMDILRRPMARLDEDTYQRLRRAGIVEQRQGRYQIRYRLFETYLRRRWQIPFPA